MTLLFVKCDTTGIDRKNDSIIQLSGTIVNEKSERSFNFKMKPYKINSMSTDATKKTGYTDEIVSNWKDQSQVFYDFVSILDEYIDILDWDDRCLLVGWNVGFDADFLREWMAFNNYDKFGRYFYSPNLDLMTFVGFHLAHNRKDLKNFRLETVYEYIFGETLLRNDSMACVLANRRIFNKVCSYLIGLKDFVQKEKEQ